MLRPRVEGLEIPGRHWQLRCLDMGVSLNGGTPKSSILIGFSIINHPFWGSPYFRKPPYISVMFLVGFWLIISRYLLFSHILLFIYIHSSNSIFKETDVKCGLPIFWSEMCNQTSADWSYWIRTHFSSSNHPGSCLGYTSWVQWNFCEAPTHRLVQIRGFIPQPKPLHKYCGFCLDQKVNMQEESGRYMSTILLHGYNCSRGSLLNSLHTTFETLRVQNIRNEIWFAKVACGAQPLHTFATPRQYFSEQNMKISLTFPAGNSCFGCNNGNSPPGIHQLHQP